MIRRPAFLISLVAAVVCGHANPATAEDATVLSVKEFLAIKKKWPNYAAIGLPLTIEGRLGGLSPRTMSLKKLPITIVALPGKRLPTLPKSTRHVRITAHLEQRRTRWTLVVHSAKANPPDSRMLLQRQIRLPVDQPKPWYELANWAFDRAEFYGDDDLKQQAGKLQEHAFRLERLSLKPDDIAGRLKLANKVKTLSLPPVLASQLRHAAHRKQWSRHLLKNDPAYAQVVEGMRRDLPGFEVPIPGIPDELAAAYRKQPIQTYDAADPKLHKVLHRLLYLEVAMHRLRPEIKADGSNGDEIAARLEKLAPEWKPLAAVHREKALQYRISRIGRLTRPDALALIEQVKQRKTPQAAEALVRTWLKARESQLRVGAVRDRIQLADDYNLFLKDQNKAIAILKAAHRLQVESDDIRKRMGEFGLAWNGDKWVAQAEIKPGPVSPLERAIRDGRVLKGMQPAQVRRAMAATPASILRIAGRRKINEVWIFRLPNNNRIAVHFERPRGQSRQDMKVVNVSPHR